MLYKNWIELLCLKYIVNATVRKLKMDRVIPYMNWGAAYAAIRMPWHLFGGTHAALAALATAHRRRVILVGMFALPISNTIKLRRAADHSTTVSSTRLRWYPCAE